MKYDNCYIPYDNVTMENEYGRYKRMADAIDALARKYHEKPFVYSLCQWGKLLTRMILTYVRRSD